MTNNKIFTTCVKKMKYFLKFSLGSVPTREKCPYPKCEGLNWNFLSASAFCQKGLLTAENIKGSIVETNLNELSLPGEIT